MPGQTFLVGFWRRHLDAVGDGPDVLNAGAAAAAEYVQVVLVLGAKFGHHLESIL
jgi:hypothetical protein